MLHAFMTVARLIQQNDFLYVASSYLAVICSFRLFLFLVFISLLLLF